MTKGTRPPRTPFSAVLEFERHCAVLVVSDRQGYRVELRGHARPGVDWKGDALDQALDSLSGPACGGFLFAGETLRPWWGGSDLEILRHIHETA